MRFFCWDHNKNFHSPVRSRRVYCNVGQHYLKRVFPYGEFWEQCGICETVWLAKLGNGYEPAPACPSCDLGKRGLAVWSLCEHCTTFRLATPEFVSNGLFAGVAGGHMLRAATYPGQHLPECGACLRAPTRPVRDHYCLKLGRPFATARSVCPFDCGAGFFPTSPAQYAATVPEKHRHPAWMDALNITEIRLVESPADAESPSEPAPFVLGHNGHSDGEAILLPRCATFAEGRPQASIYRQCFDYDDDPDGEISVMKPAIVVREDGGWLLKELGMLAPVKELPTSLKKAPPDPSETQDAEGDKKEEEAKKTESPAGAAATGEDPSRNRAAATTSFTTSFSRAELEPDKVQPVDRVHAGEVMPPRFPIVKQLDGTKISFALLLTVMALFIAWAVVPHGNNSNDNNSNVSPTPSVEPSPQPVPKPPPGMVLIEGSKFIMGRRGGDDYESPPHEATVPSFFMDEYEVTREQYAQFIRESGNRSPPGWTKDRYPGEGNLPVTGVSWNDAYAYAKWANKRLPTEEEWEFAARGKSEWLYPWGNEWREGFANANTREGGRGGPVAVGRYKDRFPSRVHDLIGNVWEWTDSTLSAYPGGIIPEDTLPPEKRKIYKVIRGGCYLTKAESATTTYRGWLVPEGDNYAETGFRCVMSVNR